MSLLPSRGPETSTRQDGEFQVVGVDEDAAPVLDALASDTAREVLNAIYENPGTPSEIAGRLDMSIQKVAYHLEKLEDVDLIAVAGTRYSEKGQEMTVYEPPDDPLVLFVGTEERKSRLRSLVRRVVPTVGALAFGSLLIQRLFGTTNSFLPFGGSPDGAGGSGGDANTGDYTVSGEGVEDAGTLSGQSTNTPVATDGGQSGDVGIMETPAPESAPTAGPEPTADVATATSTSGGSNGMDVATTGTTDEAVRVAAESAGPLVEPGVAFFLGGLFVLTVVGGWWYYRSRGR